MKQLTKTLLHKLGYRKSKDGGCYWKCRLVNRPEGRVKARVQVKLFGDYGWYEWFFRKWSNANEAALYLASSVQKCGPHQVKSNNQRK